MRHGSTGCPASRPSAPSNGSASWEKPYAGSNASLVVEAGDAVLKINFPDEESEQEPEALRAWDGDGAIRLLAYDAEAGAAVGALLVRHDASASSTMMRPVTSLLASCLGCGSLRLRRFGWRRISPGVGSMSCRGNDMVRPLVRTIVARRCRERAARARPDAGSAGARNEDFHAGNVLRGTREPWLAIDPKPIAAEREFTLLAMVRDRKDEVLAGPRPLARLRRRLDRLSSDLALTDRVRDWTIAHTIAWGFDPDLSHYHAAHAETSRLCSTREALRIRIGGRRGRWRPGRRSRRRRRVVRSRLGRLHLTSDLAGGFFFVWTLTYARPANRLQLRVRDVRRSPLPALARAAERDHDVSGLARLADVNVGSRSGAGQLRERQLPREPRSPVRVLHCRCR